mmetsp:Transcript_6172/g.17241  ORF Transcript_6172/g.17241 Transcript_6172/m.17241 type:complete len:253 (-) Transcript_6172:78-836(-)
MHAQVLGGQVIDQRVRLLLVHIVPGQHQVEPLQAFWAYNRIHHLLKPSLGGGAADCHRQEGIVEGLIHEVKDSGPGGGDLLHNHLVEFSLLILQPINEHSLLILSGWSESAGVFWPRLGSLCEEVAHLWFPTAHSVLQDIVVFHTPFNRLPVYSETVVVERFVVCQAVQLFSFNDNTIAVENECRRECRCSNNRARAAEALGSWAVDSCPERRLPQVLSAWRWLPGGESRAGLHHSARPGCRCTGPADSRPD